MSYVENRPDGIPLLLGRLAGIIVGFLGILFIPYGALAAGAWGADLGLFAIHVVEFSIFPALAIPFAAAKGDALYAEGERFLEAMVRVSPLALQLLLAPLLMFLTSRLWWSFT